jgi:tripartite-type tricarboxylate transporter receptor subunit TctC
MHIDLARRAATLALAIALPLLALSQAAGQGAGPASTSPAAQPWPQRPIRMICPFPAGGGTDFIARLAAKHLSDRLGQQVYVENRGGANGAIGLQALMQSDPDGYTIDAISDGPIVANPALYEKLAYQPLRDFIPVAMMIRFPSMLIAHPAVGIRNVAELIALAKAKPGALTYFIGRNGNFSHLGLGALRPADRHQAAARAVSRRRSGHHGTDRRRRAAHVQQCRDGRWSTCAAARRSRLRSENRPAAGVARYPGGGGDRAGFEMSAWVAIFVPAKTPKEVVTRLSRKSRPAQGS